MVPTGLDEENACTLSISISRSSRIIQAAQRGAETEAPTTGYVRLVAGSFYSPTIIKVGVDEEALSLLLARRRPFKKAGPFYAYQVCPG